MTVMGDANYGQYLKSDFEPEWIRRERYDYCDEFRATLRGQSTGERLAKITKKLLAFFL